MPPRSPREAAIPREIGADPARMSTRSTRVERQLHAVARAFAAAGGCRGCPRVSTLLSASVREGDPGPNRAKWWAIMAASAPISAHERCHMRLFAGFLAVGPGPYREPTARSSNGFLPLTRNYGKL